MIVKCLRNLKEYLPNDCAIPPDRIVDKDFSLSIGKNYVVYAITVYAEYIWYYLMDEENLWYPVMYPSPLFEVLDGRISKTWVYSFKKGIDQPSSRTFMSYSEWVHNPSHYDLLIGKDEKALGLFDNCKAFMDAEHSEPLRSSYIAV